MGRSIPAECRRRGFLSFLSGFLSRGFDDRLNLRRLCCIYGVDGHGHAAYDHGMPKPQGLPADSPSIDPRPIGGSDILNKESAVRWRDLHVSSRNRRVRHNYITIRIRVQL